ncbi:MAG: DUF92 domain-containing protein [Anaerolineales bacterium]|nr:DUF92 domain-containing protein [Anaerolineales bacterium]
MIKHFVGWILAIAVSAGAYRVGALTIGGAAVASIVGGLVFGFGGWESAGLLILFFVSSSALSRLGMDRKQTVDLVYAKGHRRDAAQVCANGAVPAAFIVLFGLTREIAWLAGMVGALAASTADTWATELGVLARRRPRLITSGVVVEPGTSGGVTLEGTLAAFAGAGLIGLTAWLTLGEKSIGLGALIGGFSAAFLDSVLGASVQAIYYCPTCERETEQQSHRNCGTPTDLARGWPWMDNNVVNLVASLFGAIVGGVVWRVAGFL